MNRLIAVVAFACALGPSVLAGPLDPPAGPIAPTAKPLSDVEPRIAINEVNTPGDADSVFRISQRGSYYLTRNVTGVSGKHGIEIAASGVTLDLNGFDLLGEPGSLDGVTVTFLSARNITIMNGSIRNWGQQGIDLGSAGTTIARVDSIVASGNVDTGIFTGRRTTLTDCISDANGSNGFGVDEGSIIENCSANANSGNGFAVGTSVTITDSTATRNGSTGFSAVQGVAIEGCESYLNRVGFSFGNFGSISSSSARASLQIGIAAGSYARIVSCSSSVNGLDGISAGPASIILNCVVAANATNGIVVPNGCTIRDNSLEVNGLTSDGAGILATGGDNRIEGNNCLTADRGIQVTAPGNLIIRNSCSGNTVNWVIAANNIVGPVIDLTVPTYPGISGNSGPDSTTTTHPHANFTY